MNITTQPTPFLTPELARAIYAVLVAGIGADPIWAESIEKRVVEGKITLIDGPPLGIETLLVVDAPAGLIHVSYRGRNQPLERLRMLDRTNLAIRMPMEGR